MGKLAWSLGGMLVTAGLAAASGCGARTGLLVPEAQGGGGSAPLACKTGDIQLVRATPTVMFVLDRSGSMNRALDATGTSRWVTLTNALSSTLPPVDQTMSIGATFFPSPGASSREESCVVSATPVLEVAKGNVSPLLVLMTFDMPDGATPTADALDVAATSINQTRAASAARALVLATDGAPNCNTTLDPDTCRCANPDGCHGDHGGHGGNFNMCLDDVRTIATLEEHAQAGLPTYVVGITDESDAMFNDVLNAMAVAGGRPATGGTQQFYEARSTEEMTAAFAAIRDQVGRCTYLTTSVPNDGGTITVFVGGVEIPFDPSGATGWSWTNQDNGEILLSAATCDAAAEADPSSLIAKVTCKSGGDAG